MLHQVVVRVVDDFLHDVRVIRIVFLAFIFFHAQVVVELWSVRECANFSDAFVRILEYFSYELFEFVAVGLEHDRACFFVEHCFNLEDWLLDLFASHTLLFVVLDFELLVCEFEMFTYFVHHIE